MPFLALVTAPDFVTLDEDLPLLLAALEHLGVDAVTANWTGSAPASYSFGTEGEKTLYGWAKDAAGNVSSSVTDTVTITLPATRVTVTGALKIEPAQ